MRRTLFALLGLTGCFNPEELGPAGDGSDSGATMETTSTMSEATTSMTSMTTTEATTSMTSSPTTSASTSSTTDVDTDDSATSNGPTSDPDTGTTGEVADCAGFDGQVVWLNFSGAELTMGVVENAPFFQTTVPQQVGVWPAYAGGDEGEILATVQDHYAAYRICVTDQPPGVPDYDLVVVVSEAYMGNPNTIGFAGTDCNNAQNNNVRVVFLATENNLPTVTKAIALSNNIAHGFGVDNVTGAPDDLMNQYVATTLNGATFTSSCYPTAADAICKSQGECTPGEQQSHPLLDSVLGPA